MGDSEVQAVVELRASIDQFVQAFTQDAPNAVNTGMQAITSKIQGSDISSQMNQAGTVAGENFGKGFMLAAAAIATTFIMQLRKGVTEAMQRSMEISTLHYETGDSSKNIQALQYAMAGVGIETERSRMMFAQFNNQIQQAAALHNGRSILERMGLDPKQMQAQDVITNLEEVADKLKNLSSVAKTAAIRQLFSRGGTDMLALMAQGGPGIKEAIASAGLSGAIIPPATLNSLLQLKETLMQVSMTAVAFAADFAEPILGAINKVVRGAQELMTAFEGLKQSTKDTILGGAFLASVRAAGEAMGVVHLLFMNLGVREAMLGLGQLIPIFNVLTDAAMALYTAWKTNFANIRPIIIDVTNAVIDFGTRAVGTFQQVWNTMVPYLIPAWQSLTQAVHELLTQVANTITVLLQSKTTMDELQAAFVVVSAAVVGFIYALMAIVNTAETVVAAIGAIIYAFAVLQGAAQNAMVTMQDFFSLGAMSITGQAGQMRAAIDTQTEGVKALGSAMMNYHSLQGSVADQSDTPTAFGGRSGRVEQHLSPLGRVQAQWASFWDKLKVSPAHPIDTGGADVGGEPLPGVPGKAKGAKGAQQLTIEHLKDSLVPYQAAIAQTKRNIKELQDSLQALGDIDTNEKAYLAQRLYNKELQQSKVLVTDIHNLMRQQEVVRTKLVGDAAKTRDPHTKETYAHAAAGLQVLIGNEQGAVNAANAEADKVRIEAAKKLLEYHKAMLDAQNTQSELAVKGTEEAGQRAMALRNVQVAAPTTTAAGEAAARAKELADAQEAITEATDTHTIAEQKAATESQILADTLRIYGHGSIEALTAQNNLTQATQAAYTAETTIEAANQQYQNKLLQTSAAVETTRKGFDSIAQEVSGPLYKAFETIQQGINPLTALFLSLFTKTQSFDDIVAVAARIVEQLALVFNALRPIIDLLLGVLIGIVDVFLELYNLIADMLSVFGIHLQKISLINTALGDLDNGLENTTQLLTVTHDLPTINQYNAGQWDNLAAKQTQANDLANAEKGILSAGFNQSIAKFGEIIGVLLAMKAILMIIEAKGVISAAFNSGGGVIGFFKSLLGIGTASTTAGGPGNDMPPVLTDEQALAQNVAADEIQQVSLAEDAANTAETLAVNPLPVTLTEDQALAGNVAASSVDLQASLQASIDANTAGLGDNVNAISGGGAGSSGSGGGLMGSLGGVGKIMGGLMDAYGIYSGFKQGGVTGGVEAGFSADSLAMLLGATGPIGIIAGVAVGLTSLLFGGSNPLIGPKPANEPDIYQTGTWGQDNANLWGAGTGQFANTPMNANGQQFAMSSSLSQQTGGLGLLQYIASYMQQGGTALPAQLAAAFKGLNTTGTDITSGKNGNLTLANGQTFNYNTLYQMAMQAFTAIQNAGGLLSAASGDLSNSATAIGYAVNGATVTADNGMTIIPGSSTPAGGVVGSLPGTTGSLTESIVTALNSFVTQFGQAVPLFVSAVSTFNVAKMMGNGNAVTSTGAGQVNVSAPTVEAGAGGAAGDINITIGQVVGTDPTQLKTTFKQVFDDLQQEGSIQAMISTRTRQFGVGVNTPR